MNKKKDNLTLLEALDNYVDKVSNSVDNLQDVIERFIKKKK